MNTKLYVDNLATLTTESDLTALFSDYGNVVQVHLPAGITPDGQHARGFVTMVTPDGARAALQALNGKAIGGCILKVSEAWPNEGHVGASSGGRSPRRHFSRLF